MPLLPVFSTGKSTSLSFHSLINIIKGNHTDSPSQFTYRLCDKRILFPSQAGATLYCFVFVSESVFYPVTINLVSEQ